jgi:hypothetical protein
MATVGLILMKLHKQEEELIFSYCCSCTTQKEEELEQQMKGAIFPICETNQEVYA